jgi:hypothetical protein
MRSRIWADSNNWTHIEWELDGVTPRMINWFWSNMEKCDVLWHPNQHMDFSWFVSIEQAGGPLGSIHVAPQKWDNDKMLNIYIRLDDISALTEPARDIIKYDHAIVAAGISLTGVNVHRDDKAFGCRLHQWQRSDSGTVGLSSAIEFEVNDVNNGLVWAKHATEEVANWEVFLPRLYELYKVIKNPHICPYYSFRVERRGKNVAYVDF